ncbi:SNF2 domain-containing protein CLASSY 1-like isoform X1 [Vitis riparia]|uniref:SNF2 domain-containing protein CLASSY 1-like isoform X1 n=1 Tax=Vitis riparia TaxID=96939 RepID=UPI00155AEA72|nr:SNF2 domain-containing protein CLASSY 1-like isoform X1 [Vitis riparia]
MRKRNLCRNQHPFHAHPFEAFYFGSWQAIELMRIEDGTVALHLAESEYVIEEKSPIPNLRIRPRKATLSDCTCFLRPGTEITVLWTLQQSESSDEENREPVWIDAKISSIERRPHEPECSCQFFVNFYITQDPLGTEKGTLSKDISVVELDQISILQKLGKYPCEDEHYRWKFSEDCSLLQRTKLFLGKFSSDLSWLVVTSVLKQVVFDVRSVQNRIVYQIVGGDHDKVSLNAVNFRVDNGISTPVIFPFVPADTIEADPLNGTNETGPLPFCDIVDLRRSKRRNVQPDRFFSLGGFSESDIGSVRAGIHKVDYWRKEEMPLALPDEGDVHSIFSEKHIIDYEKGAHSLQIDSYEDFLVCKSKDRSREVKPILAAQNEDQHQFAIVPVPLIIEPIAHGEDHLHDETPWNESGEIGEISPKYYCTNGVPKLQRKNMSDLYMEVESRWEGKGPIRKLRRKRGFTIRTKTESYGEVRPHKKRPFSEPGYKEVIEAYMKNIESTINKEQPLVIDQWKELQVRNDLNQRRDCNLPSSVGDEEESSETEMLWREMEFSIASSYLLEENEGSNVEVLKEVVQESSNISEQVCQHEYILDEEIGVLCQLCGFVSTEIKDVSPPFFQPTGWITNKEWRDEENSKRKQAVNDGFNLFSIPASSDTPLSEGNDNVWALVPDLRKKLRLHQKKAFEFLWKNIAGSMVPALMEQEVKRRGGCVISHSPGAGKTFLVISFLVSYLKLFPGKRPLVLAPKTTLYTWYKEIIKWKVPVPVYQIHGCRTYRYEIYKHKVETSPGIPRPNQDVMHVLDCLEKIQKWHAHPSILLMGYTSFLSLMREDSKFIHRRYMGEVLRQSPGILVLDEGHNPRSTGSRLRKALMKVKTNLRILLSGTLFQNNFSEYFNTLCLARPKFVNEVLRELDPKFKRNKNRRKRRYSSTESRARKFFTDEIAKRINSNVPEEQIEGLNMLRNLTSKFIDVYEGGSSDNLPGLQVYTLLMKSTTIQQEFLSKLQKKKDEYKGYPLELELLVTLGSIHPWLITTAACADKYFSREELLELKKHKDDVKKGSKVKFVLSLVNRCIIRKEKILIFCHNISPINLFVDIFDKLYKWKKGEDVLVLQGDLELFERGRVMDQFEEPGGASKVLLASITACAEGISLTAASRVILLDTEWNPSKQKQAVARAFRPGQERVVYVYQLLETDTLEEEKNSRTNWKEWVSSMIFSEAFVEDPSCWQAEKIEDDLLREIVEEDWAKSIHMIMKNEKASNGLIRGKE